MPKFNYVALDARGLESVGVLDAPSSNDVIAHLRQSGYFPTSVIEEGKAAAVRTAKKKGGPKAVAARPAAAPAKKGGMVLFQKKTIKPKTLMIFTRQLATLIDAGLPLLRGLTVLAKQETRPGAQRDDQRAGRWRAGRQHLLREPCPASEDFQQALYQHGEGRGTGRRARTGAQPAGRVPGKGGEDQEQGCRGHVLSRGGHRDRHADPLLPAHLHRAEVPADIQ